MERLSTYPTVQNLGASSVFDAQKRPYAFVKYSSGNLFVTAEDGRPIRFKPSELGCYIIHDNRTNRELAKEQLRDYWAG